MAVQPEHLQGCTAAGGCCNCLRDGCCRRCCAPIQWVTSEAICCCFLLGPQVRLLDHADLPLAQRAAGTLANLATSPRLRAPIVDAGAVAPLAALLCRPDAASAHNAASALRNLSASEALRLPMLQAGVLPPLLQQLQHDYLVRIAHSIQQVVGTAVLQCTGTPRMKCASCLSSPKDPCDTIRSAAFASQSVVEQASGAVLNLCGRTAVQDAVVAARGLPLLAALLPCARARVAAHAAGSVQEMVSR